MRNPQQCVKILNRSALTKKFSGLEIQGKELFPKILSNF